MKKFTQMPEIGSKVLTQHHVQTTKVGHAHLNKQLGTAHITLI